MKFEFDSLENLQIQLIDGDRGKNYPSQENFSNDGYCLFLSAKNVTKSGFDFSETIYIDKNRDELLRAGKLQREDIILTTRGTIGNVAYFSPTVPYENIRINSGMLIIRANQERWNSRFLYFLFTSNIVKDQIVALTSGSAVPQLPAKDIKKFQLPIIPKSIQNKIDEIIGNVTEKIHLNTQTNQTLESIAQAIFKSWFVDFEPVKAKMAVLESGGTREQAELAAMGVISGKSETELAQLQQQNPEHYQQLTETAALFPSAMVDAAQGSANAASAGSARAASELGEIPEGWEIKSIYDFGKIICGKTPSKSETHYFGQGIPFIKIPDMHNEIYVVSPTEELTLQGAESQKNKTIPAGSICVSCIATVGKVVLTHRPSQTNQQINSIVPNTPESTFYLYFQMKSKEKEFHDLASGGSATLNMNTSTFSKVNVLKPSNDCLERFHLRVHSIFKKILASQQESKELAELRDSLLPKLLSGEIDLSESALTLALSQGERELEGANA